MLIPAKFWALQSVNRNMAKTPQLSAALCFARSLKTCTGSNHRGHITSCSNVRASKSAGSLLKSVRDNSICLGIGQDLNLNHGSISHQRKMNPP
jgi:hypothetical protein